jgi:hypothetical protein
VARKMTELYVEKQDNFGKTVRLFSKFRGKKREKMLKKKENN